MEKATQKFVGKEWEIEVSKDLILDSVTHINIRHESGSPTLTTTVSSKEFNANMTESVYEHPKILALIRQLAHTPEEKKDGKRKTARAGVRKKVNRKR